MKWSSRTWGGLLRTVLAPATDGLRAVRFLAPPALRASPTRSLSCHSHLQSANAND
ncbi:hypothetical protein CU044_0872 [Streptomyces sp. L-9-10]|nr:hypothetical protein CU044_0872 [Streptomyces sp. L-9-10]